MTIFLAQSILSLQYLVAWEGIMTPSHSVPDVNSYPFDFRLLVEESLAGIYLVQGDRFLYVNRTMAQLFGYTAEEIVRDRTVEDLVTPRDRPGVRENLRRRMEGKVDALHYTFTGLRRDGSTLEVEVRGRRTLSGSQPAVIGTLLDITDRVRERERLQFLARAAELLDSSLDYEVTLESLARLLIPFFADLCFIDIHEDSSVRRLSASIDDARLGPALDMDSESYESGDAPERPATVSGRGVLFEAVPPHDRDRILAQLRPRGRMEPPRIRSMIVVPLIARGHAIGTMTLMTTSSGRTYTAQDLEFAREVARGAALAVDNARLYREAQTALQRREEVLAVVSHDLRNPLNVVLMGTILCMEQDRRQQGPLDSVYAAAKQMETLIQDLLDVSAIEAGGFSVDLKPLPLAPLVAKSVAMVRPLAERRGVRLDNAVSDQRCIAMVDASRIRQAIDNLLGNAIKFTPPGGTVRIACAMRAATVVLSVHDQGPGIPHDQLDRVFDRFWQGSQSLADGAGLGLTIVRGIAEAHRGAVTVESEPGRGSTFRLEIPLAS
jgi:PAS domain S-box-containing protein